MKISNYKILEVFHNNGTSNNGESWESTDVLVSNNDEMIESRLLVHLKKSCAEDFNFQKGDFVDMVISNDTREYNGKYYNRITAWKVTGHEAKTPKSRNPEYDDEPF